MDGVQGGSSGGDIFGTIMGVLESVLNPLKAIENIVKLCTGDSVSQSQAQGGTTGTATTEYPPAQWPGYVQGKDKSDDAEMAKTLELVEANFDLFDTGNGKFKKDGKVSLAELSMIANDPSLPEEVRSAAKKLTDSPWLMDKLDGGKAGSARDGGFSLEDVKWLQGSVQQSAALNSPGQSPVQAAQQSTPAQSAPRAQAHQDAAVQQGGALPEALQDEGQRDGSLTDGMSPSVAQSQSAMTTVLDDPSIGFEAKTNYVLNEAMQADEDEAVDIYTQWQKSIADQENPNLDDKAKALAEKREARLQIKLQHAMQKRQEMYQLLSNIETMSHDMSMAAIRNMKD